MTSGGHRKVVTALFCDMVGSTALGESVDPEALQGVLARYFERLQGIVESHGGTVEKFIGDAVMAVFGVPVAHEDDALRACRAAVEMRDALPDLGVEGRIGVNTGEVLTGTEERLATGDAVNVAARLEQAAEPGEVLVGAETLALVGAAVDVGDVRLLELKGKREPVAAYPLVTVGEVAERSHASHFVGRKRELQELTDGWERALAGPGCELVTVIGDPGVGKSRLVAEALKLIDARVVRGRCLSYGEGITYWPVVEVVKQLDALPSDEQAAAAIRSLIGKGASVSGTDEIGWAFRKLLEEQAPLVVCFDDIQWGEETFLDLVESTALLSTGAPLLLLCGARPELLDRRPRWPATSLLEPLPEDEAAALVGDAVPDDMRLRIVRASGGNPLFLTEMVALSEEGGGEVEIPPTLRAVLVARLDQLDDPERRVLERGAVEGELFHRGGVQALAPEETEVTLRLAALVRHELVRPDRAQLPREDAYRFRHLLIRDAAYDALPKATRAELHRRFAAWLEGHGDELVELDEILGYHLEQAARFLDELGQPDPELAERAGQRLAAGGRRALWREDRRAAASLLARALELTRPLRFDASLELDLVDASVDSQAEAVEAVRAVGRTAEEHCDRIGVVHARVEETMCRLNLQPETAPEADRVASEALVELESSDAHAALASAWRLRGWIDNFYGRMEQWAHAGEQALTHGRLLSKDWYRGVGLAGALVNGPRPAREALATLDRFFDPAPVSYLGYRACLIAMLGRLDEARVLAAEGRSRQYELTGANYDVAYPEVARLLGDDEGAAAMLLEACEWLRDHGLTANLSTYAPRLGRFLWACGQDAEAERWAQLGRDLGDDSDVMTQVTWRQAQALVEARRGSVEEAAVLAREAVRRAGETDMLSLQGDSLYDLAEVLEMAGRREDASAAWREALDRYERKGIIPLARRVRERLAALQPA